MLILFKHSKDLTIKDEDRCRVRSLLGWQRNIQCQISPLYASGYRDKHTVTFVGHYAKVCRSRGISEVNMTRDEHAFLGTVGKEQNNAPWLIKL